MAKITLKSQSLVESGPSTGMVCDFKEIKDAVEPILKEKLDHKCLNDTLPIYPTSENLAKWLFDQLSVPLPKISAVEVEETCTSSCRYEEWGDK